MDVKKDFKTLMWVPLGTIFVVLSIIGYANGETNSSENNAIERSFYYTCPAEFLRLGNKCYYFSTTAETWQDAHFGCKDRGSNLTAPYRWEDRNLRQYLNKPETDKHERWIGGRYDWVGKSWKWGGETREMKYQSFQRVSHLSPESLQWHCIAMVPKYDFRWDACSCVLKKHYICQAILHKVRKSVQNRLNDISRNNVNGYKPNEISVPKYNPQYNTNNRVPKKNLKPRLNVPKALRKPDNPKDVPPNYDMQNRNANFNRTMNRRRNLGNKKNRVNPESAYIHNLNALRSGKTGMSNAQINRHLRRLERLRKKEEAKKKRAERLRERQNRERNELNNFDPNELSESRNLHSRNIGHNKKNKYNTNKTRGKNLKNSGHSIDNVTQRTYLENNQISELHPKTIVEVHDFT